MALLDIVAHKRAQIQKRQQNLSLIKHDIVPTDKSLYQALSSAKKSFICEVKFSSPSKGLIRTDIGPARVAEYYAPFANAISVLADEEFFSGSYDYVKEVAQTVSCPVLCKDVVVSKEQVYEARYYGADCVLLMLSVLSDQEFIECARVAASYNMDFICEVHTEEEMRRANRLFAPIIGINNRNLKTLAIDMATSTRLAPLAHDNARVVLESGYSEHRQIIEAPMAHGFLVGSSLMKASRIDLAIRELIFGRIKICGLTNNGDAQEAYRYGAYFGGLNFAKVSKRCVSLDEAQGIMDKVPLVFGGVFVNQPINEVLDYQEKLKLAFVQLHGDETASYIADLRQQLAPSCEIWRAARVGTNLSLTPDKNVSKLLLDTYVKGEFGGTGQTFDWEMLKDHPLRDNLIIAGGINETNAWLASKLLPYALDIASGVEDGNPRKKSPEKLKDLFFTLRP